MKSNLFLYLFKNLNNFQFCENFGHLLVGLLLFNLRKFLYYFFLSSFFVRSGIREGKKSGSGINIPDLQHCIDLNELKNTSNSTLVSNKFFLQGGFVDLRLLPCLPLPWGRACLRRGSSPPPSSPAWCARSTGEPRHVRSSCFRQKYVTKCDQN